MGQLTRGKFTCCMILLGGYCLGMVIIRRSLSLLEIVLVVVLQKAIILEGIVRWLVVSQKAIFIMKIVWG